MDDEERVRATSRMREIHRHSFDSDEAYRAHMTGLAFRSSRRRSKTPSRSRRGTGSPISGDDAA